MRKSSKKFISLQTSSQQEIINQEDLQPGDIVFFQNPFSSHVSLYIGKIGHYPYIAHAVDDNKEFGVKLSILKETIGETIHAFRCKNPAIAVRACAIIKSWANEPIPFSKERTGLWKLVASQPSYSFGKLNPYEQKSHEVFKQHAFLSLLKMQANREYWPPSFKGFHCSQAIILCFQLASLDVAEKKYVGNPISDLLMPIIRISNKHGLGADPDTESKQELWEVCVGPSAPSKPKYYYSSLPRVSGSHVDGLARHVIPPLDPASASPELLRFALENNDDNWENLNKVSCQDKAISPDSRKIWLDLKYLDKLSYQLGKQQRARIFLLKKALFIPYTLFELMKIIQPARLKKDALVRNYLSVLLQFASYHAHNDLMAQFPIIKLLTASPSDFKKVIEHRMDLLERLIYNKRVDYNRVVSRVFDRIDGIQGDRQDRDIEQSSRNQLSVFYDPLSVLTEHQKESEEDAALLMKHEC